MALQKRKRYRRKTRFNTLKLKLTTRQRRSLENYCKARKTTPTKLIKKMIRPYLLQYDRSVPEHLYLTENQLDLFEEELGV